MYNMLFIYCLLKSSREEWRLQWDSSGKLNAHLRIDTFSLFNFIKIVLNKVHSHSGNQSEFLNVQTQG